MGSSPRREGAGPLSTYGMRLSTWRRCLDPSLRGPIGPPTARPPPQSPPPAATAGGLGRRRGWRNSEAPVTRARAWVRACAPRAHAHFSREGTAMYAGTRKHAATCRARSCALTCVRATACPSPPDLRTADTWQKTTRAVRTTCLECGPHACRNLNARMHAVARFGHSNGLCWRCSAGDNDAHIWWF